MQINPQYEAAKKFLVRHGNVTTIPLVNGYAATAVATVCYKCNKTFRTPLGYVICNMLEHTPMTCPACGVSGMKPVLRGKIKEREYERIGNQSSPV